MLSSVWLKVAVISALIASLGYGVHMYGKMYYERGAADVRQEWDADRMARERQYSLELLRRTEENNAQRVVYEKRLKDMKAGYEKEIAALNARSDELATASLRIPRTVCDEGAAGKAEAGSAKGGDAALAGTVVLPKQVTANLRQLVDEAGEVTAACRIAQQFIKDHGFAEE